MLHVPVLPEWGQSVLFAIGGVLLQPGGGGDKRLNDNAGCCLRGYVPFEECVLLRKGGGDMDISGVPWDTGSSLPQTQWQRH